MIKNVKPPGENTGKKADAAEIDASRGKISKEKAEKSEIKSKSADAVLKIDLLNNYSSLARAA
ncbi:MAG TPA: hypothetical protein VF604_03195 [Pyrinomonadaceae bacterium]